MGRILESRFLDPVGLRFQNVRQTNNRHVVSIRADFRALSIDVRTVKIRPHDSYGYIFIYTLRLWKKPDFCKLLTATLYNDAGIRHLKFLKDGQIKNTTRGEDFVCALNVRAVRRML
jgi:hypothetical protein